jgi:hypothetical protein
MATDQGVSITACTSAKKVGASDAIGLPSLLISREASGAATLMPWP